ncbi:MAG: N-acetylmuramoyl-L-alanine amidase [Flavobacteriaceae bacterium]|jgi:N-acetylmuramoyl-L-alanine amidase|nr:N-acetylmuramoyl-L-alanine amidase [Flavobacteriaceae bacterium]
MKKISVFFLFVAALSFLLFSFEKDKKIIVIDAAHGGSDNGAVYGNIKEKDITQNIANLIKKNNSDSDVEIVFTRNDDEQISLLERTTLINALKPSMVISLHANFSPKKPEKSGVEIYPQDNEISKNLAQKLSSKFENSRVIDGESFHILRHSEVPAVLLELGFISNEKDRGYLNSEEGQAEISKKILDFISDYR